MMWVLTAGLALLLSASPVLGQADGNEVESEVEHDPLYEALDAECTRIARLPSGRVVQDEGHRLLEGLDAERSRLESQLEQARKDLAARPGDGQLSPWQRRVTEEIEDFEHQLSFMRLSRAVIDECLASRYEELVRVWGAETEPGTLRASWDKAACTDTPGVEVARAGALDLDLEEGGVSGIVRWISEPEQTDEEGSEGTAGREITLDVMGAYEHDGTIQLMLVRPEALDEFRVRGEVRFTPMGLRGSGEIRYGITLEGCNIGPDPDVCVHQVSCSSRWTSQ
jgi:hypothetical protein